MASLRSRLEKNPPRRIVAIRTDRVGDLILSTPFLAGLRQGFPQAHITALVAPYCQEVLADSPLVNEVVTELPSERFDLALALAPRTQCWRWAYQTRAPIRLGYAYTDRPLGRLASRWLLTERDLVRIEPPFQVPHEVAQLDLLARRLGLPSTLDFPLSVGIESAAKRKGIAFHLGDRWMAGGWTFDDLMVILRRLQEHGPVTVSAGPREVELLQGRELEGVTLLTGLTFRHWAETLAKAEVLVSPDTGAVHLATAVGTPVVVAYEASTYEHCSRQWAPWKVAHRSVVKGEPGQTVDQLLVALEELVSPGGKRLSRATPGDLEGWSNQ